MSGDRSERSTLEAALERAWLAPSSPDRLVRVPGQGQIVAGKYVVDRVLGEGGMGIVVAARHHQLGQWVAIKFMRAERAYDVNATNRFVREARAAVALSSEHVAKILDVGTLETGAPYMVMEYLAGVDLGELLRQSGRLSIVDAVDAILQACEAIAEAHSIGIVHRDLKPSNLFVTRRVGGEPLIKVLDFGISKSVDPAAASGASLTASGSLIGSPGYMSPEQVRSSKEVDPRCDVWALGVVLYELLTGIAPFRADSMGETFARILSESPAPIRRLRPEIPEGLASVIAQCLERDCARRVSSVGELGVKLLPFASVDAGIAVKRILRLAGAQTGWREPMMKSGFLPSRAPPSDRRERGPAWLRWPRSVQRPTRRRVAIVIVISTAVSAGAIGIAATSPFFTARKTSTSMLAVPVPRADSGELPRPLQPTGTATEKGLDTRPDVTPERLSPANAGHPDQARAARPGAASGVRPPASNASPRAPSASSSMTTSHHETDVY